MFQICRVSFLYFIFSFFSVLQICPEVVAEPGQVELIQKVFAQIHEVDVALEQLRARAGCTQECAAQVDLLRGIIGQVISGVQQPVELVSLQFLCAFTGALLECAEWLAKKGNAANALLDLAHIQVDDLPVTIPELLLIVESNDVRCRQLVKTIRVAQPRWYRRVFGSSKLFVGIGISALVLYVLAYSKRKEKGASLLSYAMECRNKCNGVMVTPDNLYELAPKVPSELEDKLKTWFEQNKEAWQIFVEQNGSIETIHRKYLWAHQLMKEKGLVVLKGHGNFVFVLPNAPEWLVKISGPSNRACLQVANQDKPYGQIGSIDTTKCVPTCQTASRVFHGSMKLKEAVKKYQITQLEVVDGYVWSPHRSCQDEQCVVAEKNLTNHKLLRDCTPQELEQLLTQERVEQLLLAAKHAGLWNLTNDNIAINKQNGKLAIIDTEQPNTTKPSHIFNKDKKRYEHNINCGVQSFYNSLAHGSLAREYVETWARKDPEIMGAYNVKDLLKKFQENKAPKCPQ